jgi:hypothetical protein
VPYGRRLQPVAGQPADWERADRGDIDQAGLTQCPRQSPAVAQVRAAARQQLPDRVAQPVGPLLCGAAVVQAGPWLQSGIGVLDQPPGRSAAAIVAKARARSGTWTSTSRACTRSNVPGSGGGSAATSCRRTSYPPRDRGRALHRAR